MAESIPPLPLRIFVSSPGDVGDERALALQVIDQLPYDPLLRGRVTFEVVAWDKPGAGTPMLATMTPQAAIDAGLPKPSECDIVVVIFWARMGTPLPHPQYIKLDGQPYYSGTEWEFTDALQAARAFKRPDVVVYRRTEEPVIGLKDPIRMEKTEQWERVEAFFATFRDAATGAIVQGYNEYEKPEDFRRAFETHLKVLVRRRLDEPTAVGTASKSKQPTVALWPGSPFPGLRAFTPADAPIFFGRGRETDALLQKVATTRFVAVVGASGSGKSSLVGAGLLPRLAANALTGSQDWLLPDWDKDNKQWLRLRFTPGEVGDNPFMALAIKLAPLVGSIPRELAQRLANGPTSLEAELSALFDGKPPWVEMVLFIDQFEELFTLVAPDYRLPFIELLGTAAQSERLRTVVTMRSDFYAHCVDMPSLARLFEAGSFPLAVPTDTLLEMIARPAERASLHFEEGLPGRILHDTGSEPGSLALMAYLLDELYQVCQTMGHLSHADYEQLGSVQGAIGKRAEKTFNVLPAEVQAALPLVFRELVAVNDEGAATRQRASANLFAHDPAAQHLVEAFTNARLLVKNRSQSNDDAIVEVAHEALLRSWPRLVAWIGTARGDLLLLRQVKQAAQEWEHHDKSPKYLWLHERLQDVYPMLQRQKVELAPPVIEFIRPELERLMDEIKKPETPHFRRATIGDRLAQIGDTRPGVGLRRDGLPDIVWCEVFGGDLKIIDQNNKPLGQFIVKPFRIAKYPVTYIQYSVFLEALDGYYDDRWWKGFRQRPRTPGQQNRVMHNHPAENVNWFDALAFCRWISFKLNHYITLPTEWEWQQANTSGKPSNMYSWGREWNAAYTNTRESGLSHTTAVGLYPKGTTKEFGILDMNGNVWEWCLNEFNAPKSTEVTGDNKRCLRGGSWERDMVHAKASYREGGRPDERYSDFGFRLVLKDAQK